MRQNFAIVTDDCGAMALEKKLKAVAEIPASKPE
jgi:hypothetical protein